MLSALAHRGPDDEGSAVDQGLALGIRRLAVRDIQGGRQPYRSEDGSIIAVFNGELYNYAELAATVRTHGHCLRSRTDGEVLVHLYELEGYQFVKSLRGMFAFAIWDKGRQRLLLGRDHVGQKPLYLLEAGSTLAFASEMKALSTLNEYTGTCNPDHLAAYLGHRFVPAPNTMVQGIRKLCPGEMLVIDSDGPPRSWIYWQPPMQGSMHLDSIEDRRDELDALLRDTVETHLDSDVPLGLFLSGGLDSSLLAALAAQKSRPSLTAWVAYYPTRSTRYNEMTWAEEVARRFGLQLRRVEMDWAVSPERLSELAYVLDEPMADPTMIPLDVVAQAASEAQTVMLSGEGADEIFAGYAGYGEADALRRMRRIPRAFRRWWVEQGWYGGPALSRSLQPLWHRYRGVGFTFSPDEQEGLLRPEYCLSDRSPAVQAYWENARTWPDLEAMQGFDARWFLSDDVLHKADRIGMRHGLEIRVPYCDFRVVEFALALPASYRRVGRVDKWLLRQVARSYLPRTITARPKQGFPTPLTDLMTGTLSGFVREVLTDPGARIREWLQPHAVETLLSRLAPGAGATARQLFVLLMLELWAQEMGARRPRSSGTLATVGAPS